MQPVARLGDPSSHGGHIITASPNCSTDGIKIARLGDMHICPIVGHGTTPMVTGSSIVFVNGVACCRVGDAAGCGAIITSGSPTTSVD